MRSDTTITEKSHPPSAEKRRMTDGPTNEERKVVKNELAALLKISKTGGHATQEKKHEKSYVAV